MTYEQKSVLIEKACDERWANSCNCAGCPLFKSIPLDEPCFGDGSDIERNYAIMFGQEDKNPYWERICKISDKQRAKGMETYGQGLESNPAAMLKRIEHLQEELIDGLMYCEWIKDKLMELEGEKHDQD